MPGGGPLLWLHGAALLALACASRLDGRWRPLPEWRTPLDGLVASALAVALVIAVPVGGAGEAGRWLAQVAGVSGLYVGAAALLRRDPRGGEFVWMGLAGTAAALGAHAIWTATGGWPRIAEVSAVADARWDGHHVLAKTLAFATLVTTGRALERGAPGRWRLAVLVGTAGTVMHAASGGFGLATRALARLDDPLYFSSASVTFLLAATVARLAWTLRRDRRTEAARWWAAALGIGAVGASSLLGESSGGEALRALAVLTGAVVVAERAAPSARGPRAVLPVAPEVHSRAA